MVNKFKKHSLTAYLNIELPNHRKDYCRESLKMIKELIDSRGKLNIPFDEYGNFIFKIEYISKEEASKELLLKSVEKEKIIYIKDTANLMKSNLLKIGIDEIMVPFEIPQGIKDRWSKYDSDLLDIMDNGEYEENYEFNIAMIYEIFNKRIHDLILACNLSNLGSITISEYVIFQDNKVYPIGGKPIENKMLFEAKICSIEWQYPPVYEIEIVKVWQWLIKREDFLQGFSNTAVTRAIINLVEISHCDTNMKLFRAVMGIEGLYTKSKNNLLEQVKEKTQIFLGPQIHFKKLYSNMYNFRSKFIHGELDFPATINIDFSENSERHNKDLKEATLFAIILLGASLQQLILRDWDGIKFDYKANNQENK